MTTDRQARGTLYLVPTPLDHGCEHQAPLADVLPQGTIAVAARLTQLTGGTVPVLGQVPIDVTCIGEKANATRPEIEQILIWDPEQRDIATAERDMFVIRRRIEKQAIAAQIPELYLCSLSVRSLIYKGMFLAESLTQFYPDLLDVRGGHRVVELARQSGDRLSGQNSFRHASYYGAGVCFEHLALPGNFRRGRVFCFFVSRKLQRHRGLALECGPFFDPQNGADRVEKPSHAG